MQDSILFLERLIYYRLVCEWWTKSFDGMIWYFIMLFTFSPEFKILVYVGHTIFLIFLTDCRSTESLGSFFPLIICKRNLKVEEFCLLCLGKHMIKASYVLLSPASSWKWWDMNILFLIRLLFPLKNVLVCMKVNIINYKLSMRTIELMTEFDDRDHSPVDKASQSFDKVFSSYFKLIQLFIIYEQLCYKHWPLNFIVFYFVGEISCQRWLYSK